MEAAPGKTILIVEDERDVVDLLTLNLRKAGFKLSAASDGASGLQKAREDKPDFVILDLMLPKMPGLEVCRALKSDPATSHIPIMMLTAKAEEIDRIVGLEFGADDYVTKPFSPREVMLRIKAILRRGEMKQTEENLTAGPINIDGLDRALKGLLQRDDNLCATAIADDEEIDQLEKQIDKDGVDILLRYQPVASDLRRVISAMKLSPNIERVGDQATSIARRARKLNRHPPLPEVQIIVPLHTHAMSMFKDSVDAFVREDVDLAHSVCGRDDALDEMNRMANRKLTERMAQEPDQLRGYLNVVFVARCLERVRDHATNIAEDAVYVAAAEDIRHKTAAASS